MAIGLAEPHYGRRASQKVKCFHLVEFFRKTLRCRISAVSGRNATKPSRKASHFKSRFFSRFATPRAARAIALAARQVLDRGGRTQLDWAAAAARGLDAVII